MGNSLKKIGQKEKDLENRKKNIYIYTQYYFFFPLEDCSNRFSKNATGAFQKMEQKKTGKKWSVKQFKIFQDVGTWVFRLEESSTIDESKTHSKEHCHEILDPGATEKFLQTSGGREGIWIIGNRSHKKDQESGIDFIFPINNNWTLKAMESLQNAERVLCLTIQLWKQNKTCKTKYYL